MQGGRGIGYKGSFKKANKTYRQVILIMSFGHAPFHTAGGIFAGVWSDTVSDNHKTEAFVHWEGEDGVRHHPYPFRW